MSSLAAHSTFQASEAFKLAGWGYNVFPLRGKIPLTPHGHKNATTDYDTVTRWWERWPDANIGARPWLWSVVLDIDVKDGGIPVWAELNDGHVLPETTVTETGTGGYHYWFRLPYRAEMVGKIRGCIDVKTHGGYLVMPGSIHPTSGEYYKCVSWVDPAEMPVLPKHLRRHVFKPVKPVPAIIPKRFRCNDDGSNLVGMVLDAQPGDRNNSLNRAAYVAAKNNLFIFDDLADAARAIGLDEREITNTLASARRAAGQKETV